MTEHISKSIWIGKDAYMYLNRESRRQRGCKPISVEQEEKLWSRIVRKNGKYQADDDSLGGGDGTYWGRWWSWSVDTLKKMLDEAGFTYEDGDEVRSIPVYI